MIYYCNVCKKEITEEEFNRSIDKFGESLCNEHQEMNREILQRNNSKSSNPKISNDADSNLYRLLREYWGYDSFMPFQKESIQSILDGQDSLTILPTGGGKSLCYQLPALIKPGIAVVVSPLISLMKDQVDSLQEMGIASEFWNSSLTYEEREIIEEKIRSGKIRILYLAPEGLRNEQTKQMLKSSRLSYFVIDEAHCLSEWGHDFRRDYRTELTILKEIFPDCSIHTFTATATKMVQRDIAKQLHLEKPEVFEGYMDRPNLTYRVTLKQGNTTKNIVRILKLHKNQPGIIYCKKIDDVEKYSEQLSNLGFENLKYHSKLDDGERHYNQMSFQVEKVNLMIATIAFGMGIDKSNIRFIIHVNMPKNIESYYQQVGRAGRDNLPSSCYMFYSALDYRNHIYWINQDDARGEIKKHKLNQMYNFCAVPQCRHKALVKYFGQKYAGEECGACDYCLGEIDMLDDPQEISKIIIECINSVNHFGSHHIAQILYGKTTDKIRKFNHDSLISFGAMKNAPSLRYIWNIIEQLVGQGYLKREAKYQTLNVTKKGEKILFNKIIPTLAKPPIVSKSRDVQKKRKKRMEIESSEYDSILFEKLRKKRMEIARNIKKPAFTIFHDRTLREMSQYKPLKENELLRINGVGAAKLEKYGEVFLDIIQEHEKSSSTDEGNEKRKAEKEKSTIKRFENKFANKNDPSKEGKQWTAIDEEILIKKYSEGVSYKDISLQLRRSEKSIKARIEILKLYNLIEKHTTSNKEKTITNDEDQKDLGSTHESRSKNKDEIIISKEKMIKILKSHKKKR